MGKPGSAETKRALEAAKAAGEAASEEESNPIPPDRVELSSGIVLRLKAVPPFLVRNAVTRLEKPKIPILENPEKGRSEPNPADPAYLDALDEYEAQTIEVGINVLLIAGTEVLEVPTEGFSPDDAGWRELAEYFDIALDVENPKTNYLNYLKCYALASAEDLRRVLQPLMALAGLTEEEVTKAVEGFRNREARRADNGVSAKDN